MSPAGRQVPTKSWRYGTDHVSKPAVVCVRAPREAAPMTGRIPEASSPASFQFAPSSARAASESQRVGRMSAERIPGSRMSARTGAVTRMANAQPSAVRSMKKSAASAPRRSRLYR